MFGTYHKPGKGEFPDCGTLDGETTWSIWEANVGVFKGWYKLLFPPPDTKTPDGYLDNR
jgi:hypothetical protein